MNQLRPKRRDRAGSNAIEFALILPVLMSILLGIAEWGWYFNHQLAALNALREGARTGAVTLQEDDPTSAAETRARAALTELGLDGTGATVTATLSGTTPDELITVQVAVTYDPLTGLIPTPGTLGGTLTMRLEDQVE